MRRPCEMLSILVSLLAEFLSFLKKSVRAWRALRFNEKYAAKLEKKRARQQAKEEARKAAEKAAEERKKASKVNPFSVCHMFLQFGYVNPDGADSHLGLSLR